MQDNIHYLKESINHLEPMFDEFYMFVNWDKNIDKYVKETKELKDILTTINTLKKENLNIEDDLYQKVIILLNNYAKKSELACFFTACDYNLENVNKKNLNFIKEIINLFLEKRGICEYTYKEWIQAILDSGASRKKGKSGENKLINICLNNFKYKYVKTLKELKKENKCVATLTKTGEFSINNFKNNLGIDLDFKNQNKILDIVIKNNNDYFFIEAKHIKSLGGEQDKQIVELINIISKDSKNKNIHYVSFLDGLYSNILLNNILSNNNLENNKILKQQKDIVNYLEKNKNNLWINTYGFNKLLKDLK